MRSNLLLLVVLLLASSLDAQLYDDYLGNGHMQGIRVQSSHNSSSSNQALNTIDGFQNSEELQLQDVSRFLAQASFGASFNEIQRVKSLGFEAYLEEQFKATPTYLMPLAWAYREFDRNLEPGEEDERLGFNSFEARSMWWELVLKSNDQLRQRMAFALSEIFVTSAVGSELEEYGLGMTAFYDMLIRHAFGNFKDLLLDVSLSPTMGFYLSHFNNPKADSVANIFPDENYAREVMQLFSIGLYELNIDGSQKLDNNGNPIPTYSNQDIKEMAKVFTGLSGSAPNPLFTAAEPDEEFETFFGMDWFGQDAEAPMAMYDDFHEKSSKTLLKGLNIPANQAGMKDIDDAISFLFNHPSCPPFIARLLIQRLVTSNPTPDYIARVATVFVNNDQGVRGDLQAVLKAILMDDEARSCTNRNNNLNRAKLREPLLRKTHFLRALEISGDRSFFGGKIISHGTRYGYFTAQTILYAPSVFNFFLPDYQPFGILSDLELVAPEFQIHNSSTAIGYINEVDFWTIYDSHFPSWDPIDFIQSAEAFPLQDEGSNYPATLNYQAFLDLASNASSLLDRLDLVLTHGQLSTESRSTILAALEQIPEPMQRVRMGLYLIMVSPDYNIIN
ncbi:MAG: DUF1800 domain-containing protein [Bacteroidota bacterium]